jgi:PAS domain S-box-containing protein
MKSEQAGSSAPPSILVIDDEPDITCVLGDLLRHEGYDTDVACTGAEAILKAKQQHFGAVLLDLGLPDLDGLSVLNLLKETDPRLPVIILSTYKTEEKLASAFSQGAFAYLTKPYNITELKATLRQAVGAKALALKAERVESALSETQERLRQVTEHIQEVFWLTDHKKNEILYISPGYEEIWGRTCESLYASPRSWLDSIHPEDREVLDAALQKQVSGLYDEEYRIVRPEGTIRWIWDRAFPIHDASGLVYRIAGIAEDITVRKLAEDEVLKLNEDLEQRVQRRTRDLETVVRELKHEITERQRIEQVLRETEEGFRCLAEATFEAIMVTENGKLLHANQRFAEMFGYGPEKLIGMPSIAFHPPEYRDRVMQMNLSGDQSTYTAMCLRKDGGTFFAEIRGKPMPYQGRIVRVTAIHDLTRHAAQVSSAPPL